MSLKNGFLLYGLGLVLIPILLHFLMKAKPKRLMFPALQLIQVRRKTNVRRLRLRHIWLLLLRIAVIALMVLALTRPSLPAANYGLNGRESLSLLAVIAIAAGVYLFFLRKWQKARLPNHAVAYRKSLLRAGTGVGILLLSGFLVGWPYQKRISAELTAPVVDNLPVSAVLIFDTSLSMDYQHENQTRLERAKEVATKHIGGLPKKSRIAVTNNGTTEKITLRNELIAAKNEIDEQKITPKTISLNDRILEALKLQRDDFEQIVRRSGGNIGDDPQDEYLREIYLFTDLARSAWRLESSQRLREQLEEQTGIHIYVIDVGVSEPVNAAITTLDLPQGKVLQGDQIEISADVEVSGDIAATQTVELKLRDSQGQMVSRGTKPALVSEGAPVPVTFTLPKSLERVMQGELRLTGRDPFQPDDIRFFTLEVQPIPQVLLVSPNYEQARYWKGALEAIGSYRCVTIAPAELQGQDLASFSAVCLMNVPAPSEDDWTKLGEFVKQGGGLAVFLGRQNLVPKAYETDSARDVLPLKSIGAPVKFLPPEFLTIADKEHRMFQGLNTDDGFGDLTGVDVLRYWTIKPSENASTIFSFTDTRTLPALVMRNLSWGKVVVLATGVDLDGALLADRNSRVKQFSDLPRARWFIPFADHLMELLSEDTASTYNYTSGSEIQVRVGRQHPLREFAVNKPNLESFRGTAEEGSTFLPIGEMTVLGNYQLIDRTNKPPRNLGFSVNPSSKESNFAKLSTEELESLFGEDGYHLATSTEELERIVATDRLGKEVFPLVLTIMMMIFCTEHLVANRFYQADQVPEESE